MKSPVPHEDVGPNTKLKAIEWFQKQVDVHPLTCQNDSTHSLLVGGQTGAGTVYLQCPDCGYMQSNVPNFVWRFYLNRMAIGVSRAAAPQGMVRPNIGEEE